MDNNPASKTDPLGLLAGDGDDKDKPGNFAVGFAYLLQGVAQMGRMIAPPGTESSQRNFSNRKNFTLQETLDDIVTGANVAMVVAAWQNLSYFQRKKLLK